MVRLACLDVGTSWINKFARNMKASSFAFWESLGFDMGIELDGFESVWDGAFTSLFNMLGQPWIVI